MNELRFEDLDKKLNRPVGCFGFVTKDSTFDGEDDYFINCHFINHCYLYYFCPIGSTGSSSCVIDRFNEFTNRFM